MSEETTKQTAEAIARMANFETSYIASEWWTNRFMAVRLPEAAPSPLVFSMECQCAGGGCGCQCEGCLINCEEEEKDCPVLRACPTLVSRWLPESTNGMSMGKRMTALLTSLKDAQIVEVTVGPKMVPERTVHLSSLPLRCILVKGACDGIHAQTNFIAVARRFAAVDRWGMTRQAGGTGGATMLLGYRQSDLTALVMPMAPMSACRPEAA